MKTVYVAVSDCEMREYDLEDDVVPLDLGCVCPQGCTGTDRRWHRPGQVYNAAIVVKMASQGPGQEYYECSAGERHPMPARRATFDRRGGLHILKAWQ